MMMNLVLEIESAITKLDSYEFKELTNWFARYALGIKNKHDAKLKAIRSTAGYLAGPDGKDFKVAVDEAANQIDADDW
ncbi:MAG: hypothetical protein GKR87_01760 [Kiritimatiellae bacterium]|nr:hypothetical protein [Kiritimatiellia bacterium]